jgi:hypothetical protein
LREYFGAMQGQKSYVLPLIVVSVTYRSTVDPALIGQTGKGFVIQRNWGVTKSAFRETDQTANPIEELDFYDANAIGIAT